MEQKLAKACLEFIETGKNPKSHLFTVQFNPTQLNYSVSSESENEEDTFSQIADFQMKNNNVPAQAAYKKPRSVQVTLAMDLIFDSSLNPEMGIRKEVEGFLSAARNPLKRKVVFVWNKIRFEGDLSEVAAEYTMFSREGKPLRAKISISINSNGKRGVPARWTNSAKKIFHI